MSYGFWDFCSDTVGVVGAPFTFGASLVISSTVRKTVSTVTKAVVGDGSAKNIRSISEKDSSTNNISKEQNKINELTVKNQEDLLKKIQDIQSKTGIPQPIGK